MSKKILLCAFFFITFFLISFSFKKTYAQLQPGTQYETDSYFCSSDGSTIWGVEAWYKDLNFQTLTSIPANSWTDGTVNINDPHVCGNFPGSTGYTIMPYWSSTQPGQYAYVKWQTACVDPQDLGRFTYVPYSGSGGQPTYATSINVTCPPSNTYTNSNGIVEPTSCNGASNANMQIRGDGWCPFGPYCMYQGNTDAISCQGAFNQPQLVNTAPSSCGYGGACNYSYCTTANNGQFTYGVCNNTTDTTGNLCGPSCAATPPPQARFKCSNNTCVQDNQNGTFSESTCGGTCNSTCPNYAPPATTTQGTCPANTTCIAQQPSQTVVIGCPSGSQCSPHCSFTCVDSVGNTCPATTCNTVWACQSGTQWYNGGQYYYTCPASCPACPVGATQTVCGTTQNTCHVP